MSAGDVQTFILVGCISFFHAGIFNKHLVRMSSYYPFHPHTKTVVVVFGTLFLHMLILPFLGVLKFFEETATIIILRESVMLISVFFPLFLGLFKLVPSADPFGCADCDAIEERNRGPLNAAPTLSPNANIKIIDNPLPPHKGDLTCTMCFSGDSAPVSVFKCGHYVACSDCFHQFMAYGHKRCTRCCAERVY